MGFAGHTATHDMQVLSAGRVFNRLDAIPKFARKNKTLDILKRLVYLPPPKAWQKPLMSGVGAKPDKNNLRQILAEMT